MKPSRAWPDQPRRALPFTAAEDATRKAAGRRDAIRHSVTALVVSALAVAGVVAFTAASSTSAGTAFAQGAGGRTTSDGSLAEAIDQRHDQLNASGEQIFDTTENASLSARASSLTSGSKQIAAENERLKDLAKFRWPTAGEIGSPFGMRFHPILHYVRLHDGSDIGGSCGQPVYAAQTGIVIKAETGYNGGSGNNVRIAHGDIRGVSVNSGYLHLDTYSVQVGQRVRRGDQIGTVGDTGLSTSCHLHFSVYENGRGVDPVKYIGWNPASARD